MFLTEKEAKRTWCRYAIHRDAIVAVEQYSIASNIADTESVMLHAANRDHSGDPLPSCMCLASGCAAWRWAEGKHERATIETGRKTSENPRDQLPGNADDWDEINFDRGSYTEHTTFQRRKPDRKGYCGEAGKPEF